MSKINNLLRKIGIETADKTPAPAHRRATENTPQSSPKSEPKSRYTTSPKSMDDVRYMYDYCGFIRKEVPEWAHLIEGATSAFVVDSRVTDYSRTIALIFVDAANKEIYRHVGTVEGVYPAPVFLSSILEALTNNFGETEKHYIKDENDRYLYVVERRQSSGLAGWFFGTLIPVEYENGNPYPVGKRAKAMRIALENNKYLGWCAAHNDEAAEHIKASPPAGATAGNALAKIVALFQA